MPENKKFDLTKAITFLLVFTSISITSLTVLLVPSIRDYKKQKGIYKIEYSLYLKAKERHDEENAKLTALKTTNAKIITALGKKTDETSLQTLSRGYFSKTEVGKVGGMNKEGDFLHEDFNLTASFGSPKELFGFLGALSEENAVVKVKTPLVMAASDSQNKLMSNFMLRVYYMDKPQEAKEQKTAPTHAPADAHPHH